MTYIVESAEGRQYIGRRREAFKTARQRSATGWASVIDGLGIEGTIAHFHDGSRCDATPEQRLLAAIFNERCPA